MKIFPKSLPDNVESANLLSSVGALLDSTIHGTPSLYVNLRDMTYTETPTENHHEVPGLISLFHDDIRDSLARAALSENATKLKDAISGIASDLMKMNATKQLLQIFKKNHIAFRAEDLGSFLEKALVIQSPSEGTRLMHPNEIDIRRLIHDALKPSKKPMKEKITLMMGHLLMIPLLLRERAFEALKIQIIAITNMAWICMKLTGDISGILYNISGVKPFIDASINALPAGKFKDFVATNLQINASESVMKNWDDIKKNVDDFGSQCAQWGVGSLTLLLLTVANVTYHAAHAGHKALELTGLLHVVEKVTDQLIKGAEHVAANIQRRAHD